MQSMFLVPTLPREVEFKLENINNKKCKTQHDCRPYEKLYRKFYLTGLRGTVVVIDSLNEEICYQSDSHSNEIQCAFLDLSKTFDTLTTIFSRKKVFLMGLEDPCLKLKNPFGQIELNTICISK